MEIYIDKQSLIFETDNNSYSKTYNHKFVTAWVVYDDYQQGVTLKTYAKYNLTNSSFKFLTICRYTIEGELLDYMTTPDVNYSFIPPESNGENVLTTLWIYWLMHRDGLI
ncbi:MAG: hypothetical protein DBY32_03900 [Phascolarctobacterium sp.]|nr:MAG: hypothetical protein DBY32_03900 [Phascolarctobacterium sp.]